MEEEAHPIRQQHRRLNLTILDVVKKEVSPIQVVPKKSRMTVMKNQHDGWYLCRFRIACESENPIIVSWMDFLDISKSTLHLKTTFTCPFGTFVYTYMPFGLSKAPSTFQHCMTSIVSD
ncbi:hypothetical protein CR513_44915, partial [Mucuna pruriens]